MAKMTQEQFRKKYFEREKRIAELKNELESLRTVDKAKMAEEFKDAFELPDGWRLVKGKVGGKKKVIAPPKRV